MCDDFDPLGDIKNLVKKGYDGLTGAVKTAWDQTIAEVNRTGKKVLEETFRILGITSQTIYLVEMVSFPIITDPPKNVVQRAIITAVLENRDLMDDLLFESAYGISNSIQRLYDRADTEYVYDLPSVSLALNEVPNDEVLVYLNAQEGEPIAIINIEISPVDYGLWLQYRLIQFWGFNYNTSKLPTGETLLGWHIEGSDIVPEWDIEPANALYTSIPTDNYQYIHVVYEKVATPGIFYLFVYPRGGGWIVALDGVPDSGTDTFQMLPIIALRQDFANIDVDKETIIYKQTKSLLKEIGFPLDKLMEGINSQDETQLAFLEDVYLMFAVNIYTDKQGGKKALYSLFSTLFDEQITNKAKWDSIEDAVDQYDVEEDYDIPAPRYDAAPNIMRIEESAYNMVLQFNYIEEETLNLVIGDIGYTTTYTATLPNTPADSYRDPYDDEAERVRWGNVPMSYIRLTQQISDTQCRRLTVSGLFTATSITTGNGATKVIVTFIEDTWDATKDNDRERFNIPLGLAQLNVIPLLEKEELLYESFRQVMFAEQAVHLDYYETGAFGNFIGAALNILMVVLMVVFPPAGGALNVIIGITKRLLVAYALTLILKEVFSHNLSNAEKVLVLAAVAWFGSSAASTKDSIGILTAEGFILAVNAVSNAVLIDQSIQAERLQSDISGFESMRDKDQEEMAELWDAIPEDQDVDPFGLASVFINDFYESPANFYERTAHTGNPGVVTLDVIENYCSTQLKLPELA